MSNSHIVGLSKLQEIPDVYYDGLHRVTQVDYELAAGSTPKAEAFDYDDLGNRITYWDHRNAVTTAYENNVVNEYSTIAGRTVQHDAAGNMTRQGVDGSSNAYLYAYDYDNRLLSIDYDPAAGSDTRVGAFAYDALGRLISSPCGTGFQPVIPRVTNPCHIGTADPATLKYYYDGPNEIAEVDDDDVMQRRYVHGTTYIDERADLIARSSPAKPGVEGPAMADLSATKKPVAYPTRGTHTIR